MSAEPVPGVVLSADGQPTLVVRGNEDLHVWNAGAQRLFTRATLDAAVAAARAEERERCATVCEDIGDEYQRRESYKWAEMKTDAETGAHDCAVAIRDLKPE